MINQDVVVITGGTSGYGRAAAKRFADNGCRVIITGRNPETLEEAAKETGAIPFRADVTSPDDWERLYQTVKETYGKLDLLVNNAGGGVAIVPVVEQSIEDIDRAVKLNLNSVIYGCRVFAPMFLEQEHGTIINVASVCAKHAWDKWSVYASAKWGVLGFSKGLAVELGPKGVRVTCLVPGAGDTAFSRNAGIPESGTRSALKAENIGEALYDIYTLPDHVWVEEMTVWGMDQVINPL